MKKTNKKRVIYITVDDAPSKHMKEKIDYLFLKNIPSVWFCIGKNIEKNPEQVIYAIKKGVIIGNHSYSHKPFSKISLKEARNEIKKTDKIIDKMYKKAKVKQPIKLFRFPFGDKGFYGKRNFGRNPLKLILRHRDQYFAGIQQYLLSLNYACLKVKNLEGGLIRKFLLDDIDFFWTFNMREWTLGTNVPEEKKKKFIDERIKQLTARKKDEIILIHDSGQTDGIFNYIIDKLHELNFEFKLPL